MNFNLTSDTYNLLKWYSTINSNLYIEKGDLLCTSSPERTTCVYCENNDEIPVNFCTTDIHKFLKRFELFDKSDVFIDIDTDKVTLSNANKSKTSVFYQSSKELVFTSNNESPVTIVSNLHNKLQSPSDDMIKNNYRVMKFNLHNNQINEIQKASSSLGVNDIFIYHENDNIKVKICDKKIQTTDDVLMTLPVIDKDDKCITKYIYNAKSMNLPDNFEWEATIFKKGVLYLKALNSPFKLLECYCAPTALISEEQNS